MPITVQHAKSITIADGTNTNIARPVDWNSGHNITISLGTSEIIKSVAVPGTSFSNGVLNFNSSPTITFGMVTDTNGATVTASAGRPVPFFEWPYAGAGVSGVTTIAAGTLYLNPFDILEPLSFCRAALPMSNTTVVSTFNQTFNSNTNTSWTSAFTTGMTNTTGRTLILFSRQATGGGASSTNLVSFGSATASTGIYGAVSFSVNNTASTAAKSISFSHSISFIFPGQISSNGAVTYSTVTYSGTSSRTATTGTVSGSISTVAFSTQLSAGVVGYRMADIPLTGSLAPGEYWLGYVESSSSTGVNMSGGASYIFESQYASTPFIPFGNTTTATSNHIRDAWGSYGTSSSYTTTIGVNAVTEQNRFKTAFILRLDPL